MDSYNSNEEQASSIFDGIDAEKTFEYASTGERFVNYLVDHVVIYCCLALFGFFLGILYAITRWQPVGDYIDNLQNSKLHSYVLAYIMSLLVYTLIEGASKGRTLGKLITKTVAVREDGMPLTWKDAFSRSLCRLIPFDQLSALSGFPWHDKVSKTMVIKK